MKAKHEMQVLRRVRVYCFLSILVPAFWPGLGVAQMGLVAPRFSRQAKTAERGRQHDLIASSSRDKSEGAIPPGYSTARTGTLHDFDYFVGGWRTHQRRLKARGVGSNEWQEFPGNLCMALYLGAMATVDELYFPSKGSAGLTFAR